jgi:hypothetical protein
MTTAVETRPERATSATSFTLALTPGAATTPLPLARSRGELQHEMRLQEMQPPATFELWAIAVQERVLTAEASARLQYRREHPNPPPSQPSRIAHVGDVPSILPPGNRQE